MKQQQRVGPNEWRFEWPPACHVGNGDVWLALTGWERGRWQSVEVRLRHALRFFGEHLDGMNHLAALLGEMGRRKEAHELWAVAVGLGRQAFPPCAFTPGRDFLEWAWLENRPFLHCLEGHPVALCETGTQDQAVELAR
ncbi:MAG: hypothetical protein M0031_09765 [Thermaerobacter sp.]|nr:hypothetical protein [Thermaerobacter sp.]